MNYNSKIYIAGHSGMVGSAILRLLKTKGYNNLVYKSSSELDLMNQNDVQNFFNICKPEIVILAAARVGGIQANIDFPASFLYENLMIQSNVIDSSYKSGVKKFVFLGSSCIYPKNSIQPMKEEYLLDGKLESTNEGYAIAKIAGLKMLEYYHNQYGFKSISLMPCNLYGPNDSFDVNHAHVLSSLVRKIYDAHELKLDNLIMWGTGIARREFMHVDDLANAVLHMLFNLENSNFVNVGWGTDISIKELADIISKKIGFKGNFIWDKNKPDGMLRKCMDVSRMMELEFMPSIDLSTGIDHMIELYKTIKR